MEPNRLLRHLRHLLPALCLAATVCTAAEPPPPAVREWTAMGTRIRLSVRGEDAEAAADAMAEAARAALEAVEEETSAFRAESAVSRLADAAGSGGWTATAPAFDEALDTALAVAEATDGAFNPLVGPLMEKYGFPRRPDGVVAESSGDIPPELLDWRSIERKDGACRLPIAGMRLDLGGVAKGVGADRAAAAIRAVAANDFLLDAGGTLVCRGAWTIGLRDPRGGAEAPPLKAFTLADGMACATSGNYERPGHLMDPRTGRAADGNGVLQATALARTAAEADAWSTALFVLAPDAGRAALAASGAAVAAAWVLPAEDGGVEIRHFPSPPR
jgi:thiamine biosynthesis lipoprotein